MELSKLDGELNLAAAAEKGAVLELMDPRTNETEPLLDDDGKPVTITLLGSDSATYQRAFAEAMKSRKMLKVKRGGVQIDFEQTERDQIDLLAACTTAWDFTKNGEPYACTRANAAQLYTKQKWIRDQVRAFVDDRANFLGEA